MKILRSAYHFLLFLIVSWTVYNTFIFISLPLLPFSNSEYAKSYVFDFWDFYLFGALGFPEFLYLLSVLLNWFRPDFIFRFWPLLLYIFLVNGLAIYIWCNIQNPGSGCILALAPSVAGPFPSLLFSDGMILIGGIIGIIIFYTILYKLNVYRKRHWPQLTLPKWLEWRRPNMVPPKKPITAIIADNFNKYKLRA